MTETCTKHDNTNDLNPRSEQIYQAVCTARREVAKELLKGAGSEAVQKRLSNIAEGCSSAETAEKLTAAKGGNEDV